MNPKFFGRATWLFIFKMIYIYLDNVEQLKKRIYQIAESVPCKECSDKTLQLLNKNNIYNVDDSIIILHFMIEHRNQFYNNKIDRSEYNTLNDIIKNKEKLMNIIIYD